MNNQTYFCANGAIRAEVSLFYGPDGGTNEMNVLLHLVRGEHDFHKTLTLLEQATQELWEHAELNAFHPLLKRYFLSDPANQSEHVEALACTPSACAVSVIGQPPLDGTKAALWIFAVSGKAPVTAAAGCNASSAAWEHNGLTHFWHTNYHTEDGDSATQTDTLLHSYTADLEKNGMKLADNCQRTWFFVHDVDVHYGGVVTARRQFFIEQGLTRDTHYIASTGIQGCGAEALSRVRLDGYAIKGLRPEQVTYLYAPTHLNPTYEYGVTFERGTRVEYADRAHLFISGTASIDNKGEVVHVGDIVRQTRRMWENVEKLLKEGGSGLDDIAQMLIYLRDPADYQVVHDMFNERFPHTPKVILWAPVCRPKWLIEMECIAIRPQGNRAFPAY